MSLTPKQQAFVDAYAGNGTSAARAAGYAGDDATLATTASRLLKKAEVRAALDKRVAVVEQAKADVVAAAGRIATRVERQAFWTQVMCDVKADLRERLKASELLGRSFADFTDTLKHDVTDSFAALLMEAQKREQSQ